MYNIFRKKLKLINFFHLVFYDSHVTVIYQKLK